MPFHDGLDNPGTDPSGDMFNRLPFSKRIAARIAEFNTENGAPVFGIFGRWGYGKSTVMNYIKREFSIYYEEKIAVYSFNPWLFNTTEDLLTAFFAGLAGRLEESLNGNVKNVGEALQKYSGLFGMIPLVGSGASKFAEQLGRELSPNSLDKQREKMSEIMRGSPRTIVVLIDDIDRLEFDEIVTILKIVRLNANLPRLIYVLAFDDAMVSVAIGSKYGGGPDAGRQFLEKIVQYPFTLPSVGHDRLVKFVVERAVVACEGASVELSDQEWKQFQQLMDRHLARRLRTPRQAIRYANALEFALPMLKGDPNSYEQILVEGLRVLFPELYELLRDDVRSFTDLDRTNTVRVLDLKRLSSSVRRSIKTGSDDDISAGEELKIKELFGDSSRLDSIVRPINFNRYFSYALDATETLAKDIIDAIDHSSDYSKLAVNFRLYDRMPDRIIDLLYGMNLGARYSSDQRADRFLTILRALALSGSLFVAEPDKLLFKMMWREDKKGVDTNPLVDRVEQLIGDIVRLLSVFCGRSNNSFG